jgi:hypothetical protein
LTFDARQRLRRLLQFGDRITDADLGRRVLPVAIFLSSIAVACKNVTRRKGSDVVRHWVFAPDCGTGKSSKLVKKPRE